MASSNPLDALISLSQDFPKYSAAIARKVAIPDNISQKVEKLAIRGAVEAAVFINGKVISTDSLNAFS
jgi:UDP-glucose:glycoprotein glucosyltransferase